MGNLQQTQEDGITLFNSLVEHILLYGSETWTLTTRQWKRLGGTCTNMLRHVQNIHFSEHAILERIYAGIYRPYYSRSPGRGSRLLDIVIGPLEEVMQSLLLWKPIGRVRYRGLIFPDMLSGSGGGEGEPSCCYGGPRSVAARR